MKYGMKLLRQKTKSKKMPIKTYPLQSAQFWSGFSLSLCRGYCNTFDFCVAFSFAFDEF